MRIEKIKQTIKENIGQFILVLIILGILAFIFYQSEVKCLVKYTVGIPCPGCGMTRAWLSVFKGEFQQALIWHPLFWMVPFIIVAGVFMKGRVFIDQRANRIFWIVIVVIFMSVYTIRMVRFFPNQPPMNYNKQSLVYKWGTLKEDTKFNK